MTPPSHGWDTRTITNTINEFPLFSFVWGDVHAHVVSIFNQVFLLFLLLFAYKRWETLERSGKNYGHGTYRREPWFHAALQHVGRSSLRAPCPRHRFSHPLERPGVPRTGWHGRFLLAVPPVSILCYLPFYLQLKTSTGAIALVRTPSDPLEFLWVNGIFIAIFFALLVPEIRKKPWLLLACLPFALAGYVAAAIAVIPLVYFIAKDRPESSPMSSLPSDLRSSSHANSST